ncbi:Uncharacterised protein [Yersinia enterocolitica]|uniref:Uncharacterized protein n=1 Tax=Yersinia enterocolitica TaxID=630 RepID=A0A0E1NH95_YEREN|nr:hypothetical protein CH48_892 [Yersinia enterocolitica]VEA98406.1 Uncharacterised protein [Yersinia enterocolitica subsp. enterocolitica]VEF83035.1 Uncharacterised protein [Yersinia enterocolitica subsp. palearctica]KGA61037.1 hypothetical protein DJ62_1262 [Yersinia enterocolitica]KGA66534.1 hypothetical protein DJ61_76 [Yersinia enterocolitica]
MNSQRSLHVRDLLNPPCQGKLRGKGKPLDTEKMLRRQKLHQQQSHCSDFKIVILVVYYPIAIRSLQAIYINERNREAPREQ